jgi:hypothetical protein
LGGCSLLKEQGDDHWLAGTGAKFPEQGNFSILGLFLRFPFQIDEQIQSLAAKFPTQWNRECFCTDQGIWQRDQGIRARAGNVARCVPQVISLIDKAGSEAPLLFRPRSATARV